MLGVMSIFMKIFLKNYSWGIPNPEVGADQDFFYLFYGKFIYTLNISQSNISLKGEVGQKMSTLHS